MARFQDGIPHNALSSESGFLELSRPRSPMTRQGQRGPRSNEDPPTRGVLPETLDEASPNSPAFVAFYGAEKFCPHFFRVSMTHAGCQPFR